MKTKEQLILEVKGDYTRVYNCWYYFRKIQNDVFNRDAPYVDFRTLAKANLEELLNDHPYKKLWTRCDYPKTGDAVLMSNGGQPHIGVWLDWRRGFVVHAERPTGVQMTTLADLKNNGYLVEFWSYND